MKIGILDDVLRGNRTIPWVDQFALAKDLGFDGLELGLKSDYADSELWNAAGRQSLRTASRDAGLPTAAICMHAYWHYSFADSDAERRAKVVQMARESAAVAADIGCQNILTPFTNPAKLPDAEARSLWTAGIRAAAGAAEQHGVVFCLENVGVAFADAPGDIAGIVDEIGSPNVGVYYDPGNAFASGFDPLEGIRVLGARIRQVHIKEKNGTYLGAGDVPWPAIMAALREIGYDGWLVLETTATENPEKAATINRDRVRELLHG